jgi:predicted CXXCH cytochrome family protein
VRANDTCIQCHSQGQPVKNPIEGRYYDWPVGFHQGGDLKEFWKLEEHTLGEQTFTHFADGTAHKNRMQGNDFVESLMYRRGVTCFSCHDVHGTSNPADLVKPARSLCLTCHSPGSPNGPRAATIDQHTHHARAAPGSECSPATCRRSSRPIADVNVRSHTFKFITPTMTEPIEGAEPVRQAVHTDKSNA